MIRLQSSLQFLFDNALDKKLMSSSLIPERPLLISPMLAATIGLEEAIMLQALADFLAHSGRKKDFQELQANTLKIPAHEIESALPFWSADDIQRIRNSLEVLGILDITDSKVKDELVITINDAKSKDFTSAHRTPVAKARTSMPGSASLISAEWEPDDNWIRLCKQHAVPEDFVRRLVPEFVNYWRERGQSRFSWGNAFYKHVIRQWREEQTRRGAHELMSSMSAEWSPSIDASGILINSGISRSFIEDAIPEFVLYWQERGVVHGAWNTKFIEHIRRQWAKFSASFGFDDTPKPIPEGWEPSIDCYEILELAEIDLTFARGRIPEFVMYWKDSQQVKSSWNTVFLQYVKQNWAKQLKQLGSSKTSYAQNQSIVGSSQQKIKERFQQITDRSWAE